MQVFRFFIASASDGSTFALSASYSFCCTWVLEYLSNCCNQSITKGNWDKYVSWFSVTIGAESGDGLLERILLTRILRDLMRVWCQPKPRNAIQSMFFGHGFANTLFKKFGAWASFSCYSGLLSLCPLRLFTLCGGIWRADGVPLARLLTEIIQAWGIAIG